AAIDQLVAVRVEQGERADMDPDSGPGGGLAHRGEDRIVAFEMEVAHRALAVAVEQAAHLWREQHRRAARRRAFDRRDEIATIHGRIDAGLRLIEGDLHACSSGSGSPLASSAYRSSLPPTWRPSINIW